MEYLDSLSGVDGPLSQTGQGKKLFRTRKRILEFPTGSETFVRGLRGGADFSVG